MTVRNVNASTVVLVEGPGQDFELGEVALEGPRADEVLVRIVATGLCHTDITIRDFLPAEMFPNVFGHEGAGVVEAVGADVAGIEAGDHVVLSFRSCRTCAQCQAGHVGYCESSVLSNYMGMRMDGSTTYSRDGVPVFGSFFGQSSFSQYAIAYADNCVVVDKALDLVTLAPFGCGFQTGAGTVLNLIEPAPGTSLVVFGIGAVGIAAVAAAASAGIEKIVAVDLIPGRLDLARAYGAHVVNASGMEAADVVAAVRELTGGVGASYAIDTTAIPAVVLQAQHSLAVRGTLIALGLGAEEYTIDAIDLLQSGKLIRASVEGESDPHDMVPRLIDLVGRGQFDLKPLIRTYPFAQINDAVADMLSGEVIKPVLVW